MVSTFGGTAKQKHIALAVSEEFLYYQEWNMKNDHKTCFIAQRVTSDQIIIHVYKCEKHAGFAYPSRPPEFTPSFSVGSTMLIVLCF